jgi:TIR domain
MTVAGGGGIFVSYRRQEGSHLAGRVYDHLIDRFGQDQVFIDVDTIEPGVDFAEEISRAVAACRVLLAIIGTDWLTVVDGQGRRRLDDPDDFVRLEVGAALDRGVRVIPILTEGAVMPTRHDLPESLTGLARRNALIIRHESFRSDVGRLITAIEWVLAAPGVAAASNSPRAHAERSAERGSGEAVQTVSGPGSDDAARAARRLGDAERIANSIRNARLKASTLSDIAMALAATDSDHAARLLTEAERTAISISNENSRISPLSEIAQALAATDPDRAAQLLTDAERAANSITEVPNKAQSLSRVAKALVAASS